MTQAKPRQRERLIAGMIAAVARDGYAKASVARVIEQAGVSRTTFYEHFASKEECFLAAYREVAARVERDLERVDSDRGAPSRPAEVIGGLLDAADGDPAGARLVLLEVLGAGETARGEHERLLDRVEASIDRYLGEAGGNAARIEIPARALMGGVANVLAMRIFQGETGRLGELLDDLLAWLGAYALPAGKGRRDQADWARLGKAFGDAMGTAEPAEPPRHSLPRGSGALPPGVVASEHRRRIIAATARVNNEKGYLAMTVADIVAAAGVAREAFYENFRGKEGAFLAVQAQALQQSIELAGGEFFREAPWPDRVWNSAIAMLGYVARNPDLASVQLVETYTVGPASIRRIFDSRMAYTLFLEDGYRLRPEAERLPRLCSEAIAGAIQELLRRKAVAGPTERMLEIAPEAVYVALAPFIGPEKAIELVESKVATARRESPSARSRAPGEEG
jgi:AcrR family transcriptional regulator